MNVFRHNYVSVDEQSIVSSNALQGDFEDIPRRPLSKPGLAAMAAESHEVSLPGFVEAFQSPRHAASLRPEKAPLKQNQLEWATGRVHF
jgi:hypothetical protein